MPKLTKTLIDALEPPKRGYKVVWDTELAGFGVCLTAAGAKSYVVQYRNADGLSRRMVVAKSTTLAPELARREAKKKLGAVAGGEDPLADRKALRAGVTVSELCDWYLTEARAKRLLSRNRRPIKASSLRGDESRINEHIKPLIGGRAVRTLTLGDVERLQADVAAGKSAASSRRKGRGGNTKGGAGAASRAVATLRAIFGHAVRWGLIGKNPALGVRQLPLGRRSRRLSEDEIAKLGTVMRGSLNQSELPAGVASVQLMLLTGFRRMEALALRYQWLDEHCIHFPDTKTGKQLRVIGSAAQALIDRQKVDEDQVFVFPSDRSKGHLIGADRVLQRLCVTTQLEGVTLHTLRHTFASVAADLGFTELTIARLLGHAAQGVTQRYIHVDRSLVSAADQVSAHIAGLLALDLARPPLEASSRLAAADPSPPQSLVEAEAGDWPYLARQRIAVAAPPSDGAPLRALRSDSDYKAAVDEYRRHLASPPEAGSPAARRLEVLELLICTYEEARESAPQDPVDTLVRVMKTKGKTPADLALILGASSASAVLAGARPLSVEGIRQIRAEWGVPAALLAQPQ